MKNRTEQVLRDIGREFQIIGTAALKLRVSNDVRINGAERRLVLKSLVERQRTRDEAKGGLGRG